MSNNLNSRDFSLSIGKLYNSSSISTFQNLNDRTLCVLGSSFKGKAFVPTNITNIDEIAGKIVINSLENTLGGELNNNYSHLYDTLHYGIESQSYDAIKTWLDNGGQQLSFTRVLGIGSNIETSDGTILNAGFNAEKNISRGSLDNLTKTNNPNAIQPSNVSGNVSFLLQKYENGPFANADQNYLEDLGLDSANENFFITNVLISSQGVIPSLFTGNFAQHTVNVTNAADYSNQINEVNTHPQIELLGLSSQSKFTTLVDNSSYRKKVGTNVANNAIANDFYDYFLEKGHICYAKYTQCGLLSVRQKTKLLTTRAFSSLSNAELPDFNSFEQKYQTAKTPWVTSQPINRSNLSDNRETIHENVIDLFRFHSLDDGDVGNRFRVKINPHTRGVFEEGTYTKFDLYVYEYDARLNTFVELLSEEDLDLNPDSPRYISRVLGDENTYYNVEEKKVVTELKYEISNRYLRVEVHPDVEDKKINCNVIPSGFRAYPHIRLNANCFPDYDFDFTKIYSSPVHYMPKYATSLLNQSLANHWGVIFNNRWRVNNADISSDYISPHYYHTKYYLSDLKSEGKNIWVQDDSYLNSFFHLEKIYYNGNLNNLSFVNLKYSRKAASAANRTYLDLSSEDIWDDDNTLIDKFENRLSFDFFTYGGFDGVDIRDLDKRFLNNRAIQRETRGEDSSLLLEENPTFNSYNTALNLVNDRILNADYLVLPGISNTQITERVIQICEDNKDIIALLDVSGYNSVMNFDHLYVADVVENYLEIRNRKRIKSYSEVQLDLEGNSFNVDVFPYDQKYNETISLLEGSYLNSKYVLHLFGTILADSVNGNKKVLDPCCFVIKKIAINDQNIVEVVQNETINDYSMTLLQSSLDDKEPTWESDSEIFRRSFLNVLNADTSGTISLYSKVTAYDVRNSAFSLFNIVNTLLKVKKEIKLSLMTENLLGTDQPMLFNQNSSIANVYSRLDVHLNLLLNNLVNNNVISNYNLDIPNKLDDLAILDAQNYIIRGAVTLQFNENDDFVVNLSLSDIINQISLLSDAAGSEILIPSF